MVSSVSHSEDFPPHTQLKIFLIDKARMKEADVISMVLEIINGFVLFSWIQSAWVERRNVVAGRKIGRLVRLGNRAGLFGTSVCIVWAIDCDARRNVFATRTVFLIFILSLFPAWMFLTAWVSSWVHILLRENKIGEDKTQRITNALFFGVVGLLWSIFTILALAAAILAVPKQVLYHALQSCIVFFLGWALLFLVVSSKATMKALNVLFDVRKKQLLTRKQVVFVGVCSLIILLCCGLLILDASRDFVFGGSIIYWQNVTLAFSISLCWGAARVIVMVDDGSVASESSSPRQHNAAVVSVRPIQPRTLPKPNQDQDRRPSESNV